MSKQPDDTEHANLTKCAYTSCRWYLHATF